MCGNIKVQGNHQTFNGVLLQGDVTKVNKAGFTLATIGQAADGREFQETHEIIMSGKKTFDIGDRVLVKAELEQVDTKRGKRTKIKGLKAAKADPGAGYINLARLIGPVRRYDYRGATATQRAFGNVLIDIGEKTFRAVVFNALAAMMDRVGKRGAIVQMEGRLQTREYENRVSGDLETMLEIATDDQKSKVIVPANENDPFTAFEEMPEPTDGELAELPI